MADEPAKSALEQAGIWLGGGGALAGLGVLLRGLLSGAVTQEREMREDLRTEVARLREVQEAQQAEIRELRSEVRQLSEINIHLLTTRADARADLNARQRAHSLPVTVWSSDPPHTSGGTP